MLLKNNAAQKQAEYRSIQPVQPLIAEGVDRGFQKIHAERPGWENQHKRISAGESAKKDQRGKIRAKISSAAGSSFFCSFSSFSGSHRKL